MQFQFSVILVYLGVSAAVVGAAIFIGRFLRPQVSDPQKATIYECGERSIGSAWFNFNPRFYLLALVFIVFDVEIALTYPVAVVVKEWVAQGRGGIAVLEILLFLAILAVALAYIWGKGELEWVRGISASEDES